MKLLAEISDKSLGLSNEEILNKNYNFRKSGRAVLLNNKNEVCLQYVGRNNYYKLPGGGVEIGESEEQACIREILEEVGCKSIIEKEIGIIIEYRSKDEQLLHVSYGYIARVEGPINRPNYEQGEMDDQFELLWKTFNEALQLLEDHFPKEPYRAPFIVTREKIFLKEAIRLFGKN